MCDRLSLPADDSRGRRCARTSGRARSTYGAQREVAGQRTRRVSRRRHGGERSHRYDRIRLRRRGARDVRVAAGAHFRRRTRARATFDRQRHARHRGGASGVRAAGRDVWPRFGTSVRTLRNAIVRRSVFSGAPGVRLSRDRPDCDDGDGRYRRGRTRAVAKTLLRPCSCSVRADTRRAGRFRSTSARAPFER